MRTDFDTRQELGASMRRTVNLYKAAHAAVHALNPAICVDFVEVVPLGASKDWTVTSRNLRDSPRSLGVVRHE